MEGERRLLQAGVGTSAANVRLAHVFARLHRDEPAHRAAEFTTVRPLPIEVVRASRGGGQKLHAVIVQYVDEPSEAPRQVTRVAGHPGYARQEQHGKPAGELEVVALRSRAVAKRREVEPDGAARAPAGMDRPPSTSSRGSSSGPARIASNAAASAASDSGTERHVPGLDLLQRAQSVVDTGIDLDDVEPLFQQRDRGQEALALQPSGHSRRAHSWSSARTRRRARRAPVSRRPRIMASAMSDT
jgi:hypothetical protein